jgi:hypothetical protein
VQAEIIRELDLPSWMYVFVLGRFFYPYIPPAMKRVLRRLVGGSKEQDL